MDFKGEKKEQYHNIVKEGFLRIAKETSIEPQHINRAFFREMAKRLYGNSLDHKIQKLGGFISVKTDVMKELDLPYAPPINNSGNKNTTSRLKNKSTTNPIKTAKLKVSNSFCSSSNSIYTKGFKEFVETYNRVPTITEFRSFTHNNCIHDLAQIREEAFEKYPELNNFLLNETTCTESYNKELEEKIKKYKKFIITTAVSEKKVDINFLNSLKSYADKNEAMILVMPCEDVASRKREHKLNLDPQLKEFNIVFKDTYINKNLCLCAIKTSAKALIPITGLDRLSEARQASIICASPKQFLKFIPTHISKIPHMLCTTGAVTANDYSTDYYMSLRTSTLAENDHQLGAVLVEVQSNKIFHFRHITASETGSICDLGAEYLTNGDVLKTKNTVAVLGDMHFGAHDTKLLKAIKEVLPSYGVSEVILHDIFNASSVTHHDIGKIAIRASKALKGLSSLETEGKILKSCLENLTRIFKKVTIVKSNHDLALERYLCEGRFVNDPENFYFSLDLAKKVVEEEDPLKFMLEEKLGLDGKNIKWLQEDEHYIKYGCTLDTHGHRGANGAKGSLKTFENAYGNCIVGHTHSPSISRKVMCVGTSCLKKQGYNKGLSSWVHCLALLYENGTKQLVNFVEDESGKYSHRRTGR